MSAVDRDAWYQDEPPWGAAIVTEMRRCVRRAARRPVLTLVLALLATGLVVMRVARRPTAHIAHVVIAVTDGSLAAGEDPTPVRELQAYMVNALLPDDKLAALIEEKNLSPLRKKLGMPYAIGELRDMFEVTVYRNYFLDFSYDNELPRRTARADLAVTDTDGELAFDLAQRLADIIVDTENHQQALAAEALLRQVDSIAATVEDDVTSLDRAIAEQTVAVVRAEARGDAAHLPNLRAQLASLERDIVRAQQKLTALQTQIQADRVRAGAITAGLGLEFEVVAARPPPRDQGKDVRLGILAIVVFLTLLPITAIGVGAFDPRIHEAGDVTRLGFTALGHLPAFRGDRIGSLRARGIRRRRAAQY